MRKFDSKKYFKERRAVLKAMGICVDCQVEPAAKAEPGKKPHVCCENCLKQRRDRWINGRVGASLPFTGSMQL